MTELNTSAQKGLRPFDLTMIVVSFVIGMGIFKTPATVAANSMTPSIFFIAWVIGGLIALSGALTYAEIGSRYPVTGGYYKIFSRCYHPSIAFAINCIILVSNAASVAAVALVGAEYIGNVAFEAGSNTVGMKMWIAGICIGLFYGVNLLGLRTSAVAQNVLMLFKICLLLMMISVLFVAPNANIGTTVITAPMTWSDIGRALGICLVSVSFTYGGYQQTINMGGDIPNASRMMPRAILSGIAIVLFLYLGANFAYYRVIGFEQLGHTESIAAVMAAHLFGAAGFQVVSWLFFFSVLGYVNVMLLANPRVMYAMSEEGTMPAAFQQKNAKTDVMVTSLTVFTILSIFTLFYAQEFDIIINYIMFLDCIGMATSAATIFILRRQKAMPEQIKEVYKVPLYPILPIFYILAYIFIAISVFVKEPAAGWNGLGIFVGFLGLYWVGKWWKKN